MKTKREIVTPYLGLVFTIVALTGILMFFHLLDGYTEVVHEFLGLVFASFAILHIISNWKSIRNYSKKQLFVIPAIVVIAVSVSFIIIGRIKGNMENTIIQRLLKAPASDAFRALNIDYHQAEKMLLRNNISITDSLESIEEISTRNRRSPEEIVELVME